MRNRALMLALVVGCVACGSNASEEGASPVERAVPAQAADGVVIPLEDVKPSQSASVWQMVADTEITVTYDRPVARGRELFGGIVPYGEVWNPGANDATRIEISRPVMINGRNLDAGAYSIWAVPDPDEWTVIFNRQADVYHTPYPGTEHDALRLAVQSQRGEHMETLAFYFPVVEKKDAELRLHWGDTIVPLDIVVP